MRQTAYTLVLVTALLATSACRTNKIKEHIDDIDTVYVTTQRPTSPRVTLGGSTQQDSLAASMSNLGSAMVATQLERRLDRVVQPPQVQKRFIDTFLGELDRGFQFKLAKQEQDPCDAWIDVEIVDYGIWSATAEGAVQYFLTANAQMRKCDDERLIWEDTAYHQQPITAQYVAYDQPDLVKGFSHTINLAYLSSLDDRHLAGMFDLLAESAAAEIVNTMITDAFGSRPARRSRGQSAVEAVNEDDGYEDDGYEDDGYEEEPPPPQRSRRRRDPAPVREREPEPEPEDAPPPAAVEMPDEDCAELYNCPD